MKASRIALILIATIGVISLAGCKSNKAEQVTEEDRVKLTELYDTPEEAVTDQVNNIKYDLASIVELARTDEDREKYPISLFVREYVPTEEDKNKKDEHTNDDEHTNEDEHTNDEDHENEVVDNKSVDDFMELTGTVKQDYSNFAIVFNRDDNYLVAVVRPTDEKLGQVQEIITKAIGEYNTDGTYKIEVHNGHLIITSLDGYEEINEKIISNMASIDNLIADAVKVGFDNEKNGDTESFKPEEGSIETQVNTEDENIVDTESVNKDEVNIEAEVKADIEEAFPIKE